MKVIKTYQITSGKVICRSFPAFGDDDRLFGPSQDPIVLCYSLDASSKDRLKVSAPNSVNDQDLLNEILSFITTLKTMYQL